VPQLAERVIALVERQTISTVEDIAMALALAEHIELERARYLVWWLIEAHELTYGADGLVRVP
jgi:hypothetical protein